MLKSLSAIASEDGIGMAQKMLYKTVAEIMKETQVPDQNKAPALYIDSVAKSHEIKHFQIVPKIAVYVLIETE